MLTGTGLTGAGERVPKDGFHGEAETVYGNHVLLVNDKAAICVFGHLCDG